MELLYFANLIYKRYKIKRNNIPLYTSDPNGFALQEFKNNNVPLGKLCRGRIDRHKMLNGFN